jgi:hypothetical protein
VVGHERIGELSDVFGCVVAGLGVGDCFVELPLFFVTFLGERIIIIVIVVVGCLLVVAVEVGVFRVCGDCFPGCDQLVCGMVGDFDVLGWCFIGRKGGGSAAVFAGVIWTVNVRGGGFAIVDGF